MSLRPANEALKSVNTQQDLPLFPLNTVLFPGMSLSLHIFEERYKAMIGQCIKTAQPFGVVLIRSGEEVGSHAAVHTIGTTAHITKVERLPEGRLNIVTLGYRRFRILHVRQDLPYLVGRVEEFPLSRADDPDARNVARSVLPLLRRYLGILATLGNVELDLGTVPTDPQTLAYLTAIILKMPMKDKQELLDMPDLVMLLQSEFRMLQREAQILRSLLETGSRMRDDSRPFSVN
jgi:Lon protease-like protein